MENILVVLIWITVVIPKKKTEKKIIKNLI